MLAEAKGEVESLSSAEAQSRIEDGALVVDVREKPEYEEGHLPGAIHVSRGSLEVKADAEHPAREPALEDRSRPVVTYCTGGIGARSALAAQTLKRMGFERVACLEGGLEAWKEAGNPVEP
jgi:rhodanese-related sulfurtransferase